MSKHWHELHIALNDNAPIDEIEDYLLSLGALSLTQVPSESTLDVLEPKPGETPVWQTLTLKALFEVDTPMAPIMANYQAQYPQYPAHHQPLADQVWERAWMAHYQPIHIHDKFWIIPKSQADNPPTDQPYLKLDPGLAFGTGTHPTTALCLGALCDIHWPNAPVILDYGCGSGILALAALKLGAQKAFGVDYDQQALISTQQNAKDNDLSQHMTVYLPEEMPEVHADVLVANILAGPLMQLKATFEQHVHENTRVILSGILNTQLDDLLAHYQDWPTPEIRQQEEWICLIFDLSAQ